jgi:hypothetical protein
MTRFLNLAGDSAAPHGLLVCRTPPPGNLPGGHQAIPWHMYPEADTRTHLSLDKMFVTSSLISAGRKD